MFFSKYLCTEILIKISTDQTTFIIFYSSLPIHVWTENMGSDRNLMSLCFYMYQTVCTILITPYIVIYIYNLKSRNLLHCPHVPKQRNCVSSFYKLYSLYCIVTSFLYNVTQGNLLGDSFSIFFIHKSTPLKSFIFYRYTCWQKENFHKKEYNKYT